MMNKFHMIYPSKVAILLFTSFFSATIPFMAQILKSTLHLTSAQILNLAKNGQKNKATSLWLIQHTFKWVILYNFCYSTFVIKIVVIVNTKNTTNHLCFHCYIGTLQENHNNEWMVLNELFVDPLFCPFSKKHHNNSFFAYYNNPPTCIHILFYRGHISIGAVVIFSIKVVSAFIHILLQHFIYHVL